MPPPQLSVQGRSQSSPEPTRRPPAAQRATWQLHVGFPCSLMGLHPLPRDGRVPWAPRCTVTPSLTGATFEHFTTTPQAEWPLGRAKDGPPPTGAPPPPRAPWETLFQGASKAQGRPWSNRFLQLAAQDPTPWRASVQWGSVQAPPAPPPPPSSSVRSSASNRKPQRLSLRAQQMGPSPKGAGMRWGFQQDGGLGAHRALALSRARSPGARSFPASQAVGLSLWKKAARLRRGGERREVILISRGLPVPTQLKSHELQVV